MLDPDFLWFCQLARDGEFVGTKELSPRKPTLEYLSGIIETAAEAGFSSLLTATNYHHYNETWTAGRRRARPHPWGRTLARGASRHVRAGAVRQDGRDRRQLLSGPRPHQRRHRLVAR